MSCKRCVFAAVLAVTVVVSGVSAFAGPKWEIDEDSWLKLSFLGQAHYSYNDDAVQEQDFYLRRGRIILAGQISEDVKFFMETDNDNAGKSGVTSSTDIQDAFIDVKICDHASLEAGLVLLPFSFETKSSAASLLGVDYNAESIKLANTFVWRDYGVELYGMVADCIEYRVGTFDGYDSVGGTKNPAADLRFTGHVALNIIGKAASGGWFYSQNSLGKKNTYLAIGAGFDTQDNATAVTADDITTVMDSDNWVVDLQSSFDIGDKGAILLNGAYYDWDSAVYNGSTAFAEAGILCKQTDVMLTAKYSLSDPNGGKSANDYTAGIHIFPKGHNVRAGVEYTWGDTDGTDGRVLGGLQFLL